ncbi:uncharacterized protein EV422DRAFT_517832 [Fimicolochytrium jonesii]|uniref:uncharacterized protein n=1 Tax=Fimicolochytrium jonesii TaxID=1396493 RepID=UPI0022FE3ED9|nr:uncharacterized protein EV422DRAFT_517832 [Fimicolochytrium jonesii]KAI8825197.1 hypothetical protein EV422DRAFT_517832 [Fimicolochytrium jonesii]
MNMMWIVSDWARIILLCVALLNWGRRPLKVLLQLSSGSLKDIPSKCRSWSTKASFEIIVPSFARCRRQEYAKSFSGPSHSPGCREVCLRFVSSPYDALFRKAATQRASVARQAEN